EYTQRYRDDDCRHQNAGLHTLLESCQHSGKAANKSSAIEQLAEDESDPERDRNAGHRTLFDFVLERVPGLARLLARLVSGRPPASATVSGCGVALLPDRLANAGELFLQLLALFP